MLHLRFLLLQVTTMSTGSQGLPQELISTFPFFFPWPLRRFASLEDSHRNLHGSSLTVLGFGYPALERIVEV